jgi:predicted nucleic acid-binding protein
VKGYLLDTNVPSEVNREGRDQRVAEWVASRARSELYISVVTVGEIRKGIALLPVSKKRQDIQHRLETVLLPWFGDRILPVTQSIAEHWGRMEAERQLMGKPLKMADGLIAATGLEHDLVVATRDADDFAHLGVEVVNPWEITPTSC